MLEPIIGNAGSISAKPKWLQKLRDLCSSHGSLLLIDEVKSGFRVAKGGAQQLYGIYADLTTFAKAMGNGYPVAAFGGRADVMDSIGNHSGGVVHGGTYTGNLVALRAATVCLDVITNTPALKRADDAGNKCMQLLSRVFNKHSVPHTFAGPPAMFGIHLGKQGVPVTYETPPFLQCIIVTIKQVQGLEEDHERSVCVVGVEADSPRGYAGAGQ